MTKLLIRLFIKNSHDTHEPAVREKYGILAGFIGIFCNLFLTVCKFVIGSITHSISITADAANNFSDMASSVVTVVSFKLSAMPADDEHPFGHGRFEYIASLIISFFVLFMGFELSRSSVDKILHPEAVLFSTVGLILLILSIFVKLWMAFANKYIGKLIDSQTMQASSTDSRNDVISTSATVLVMLFTLISDLPIDGYIGLGVALFVIYSGISLIKDTISPLLGEAVDTQTALEIESAILSYDGVIGVHDLVIHNYGPGRIYVSAHAEVPSTTNIMESHDTIDRIERDMAIKFKCEIVLHMDPIIMDDERTNEMKKEVLGIVKSINSHFSIHDFRMVEGPTHTNLIFDVLITHKYPQNKAEIINTVQSKVQEMHPNYFCVIKIDTSYIDTAAGK